MKKLFVLLAIALFGVALWSHFTQPVDPEKARASAQQSPKRVAQHFFNAAMQRDQETMASVSIKAAKGSVASIITTIEKIEKDSGSTFAEITFLRAGDVYNGQIDLMVILLDNHGEIMTKYLLRCNQDGAGLWFVSYLSKS